MAALQLEMRGYLKRQFDGQYQQCSGKSAILIRKETWVKSNIDSTHLPFQTAWIERWPPGSSSMVISEEIETWYPGWLWSSLGELIWGVSTDRDQIKQFFDGCRYGEDVTHARGLGGGGGGRSERDIDLLVLGLLEWHWEGFWGDLRSVVTTSPSISMHIHPRHAVCSGCCCRFKYAIPVWVDSASLAHREPKLSRRVGSGW
jgi:hypothetical protein